MSCFKLGSSLKADRSVIFTPGSDCINGASKFKLFQFRANISACCANASCSETDYNSQQYLLMPNVLEDLRPHQRKTSSYLQESLSLFSDQSSLPEAFEFANLDFQTQNGNSTKTWRF
jgi:hypothetical protein